MNEINSFIGSSPFLALFVSFIIGYLFMPVVLKIAKRYQLTVSPNKRTSHNGVVPFVGGINIFISFLITVFLFSYSLLSETQFMLLGLFIILIVGFIDDLIDIKACWKLIGEIVSGFSLIVLSDVRITNLNGFLGIYELSLLLSYFVSFLVFVAVINSINLIDGIDGLASGLGIIYSLFFGIYFALIGSRDFAITAFSLVGSLSVFFLFNVFFKKKKIFMGDSGSLLLGYMVVLFIFKFCEVNIADHPQVPEKFLISSAPAVAFTLLIVPVFDTIRVIITRLKKGQSPFQADRNHIHHLMLKLGFKHSQVSIILMGFTLCFLVLALLLRNSSNLLLIILDLVIAAIFTKLLWNKIDKLAEKK